jgi:hypothetical protein
MPSAVFEHVNTAIGGMRSTSTWAQATSLLRFLDHTHSIRLLWTSDQFVAEATTYTMHNKQQNEHPCPHWYSDVWTQWFSSRHDASAWAQVTSLLQFLDHTQFRHTTLSRTPRNKWSAHCRDHYLHNTQWTQQMNIHALSSIWCVPCNQVAADLRHRPHSHWVWQFDLFLQLSN